MRILCLGNPSELTDQLAQLLADSKGINNHGLLSSLDNDFDLDAFAPQPGIYHTSLVDLNQDQIKTIANLFDQVIVLDQALESYDHPNIFTDTNNLALSLSTPVEWQNPTQRERIEYWQNLVQSNKSICAFPFIELLAQNGSTTVCCRSATPITEIDKLKNFATDENYMAIRQSMIQGKKVVAHCDYCYKHEEVGQLSTRQVETVEWAMRLNLESVDDLTKITDPVYYEVRPSNVCNLMCRMCVPKWSSLIEREWKELGWLDEDFTQNFNDFSMVQIDKAIKLYIAGGEPTAMPEFYTFLKKCIDEKHTGFEIQVNTNASKISNRLLGLTKNFSNFSFTVSIDGYQDANDYTRWGSQWHTVVDNIHRLQRNGHSINFNIVVSLLTIFSFHDLVRFLDSEFPGCLVHAQLADNITPFVIPYSKDQLAKIETIKQTSAYSANELFASFVDTLLNLCKKSTLDKSKLQHFFSRNDTIDISRDSCLNDYIPELEKLRELL